ncbi:hypothetical protein M427DRAFT_51570 [Gonapodya prolifera JEL478]|uniref:MARVEL domain-containing protein n=1 Tax=Gonapodya prolifera (strain JEL478) TaxID=1344416 RepID=A0A139AX66_GONPJ|nr:hypothetical protein M427DRAFT_51570 [Gonapodya prolifera JEL478]|eukprot:KXS21342.1 hypothetical protein M427DRAFT_51570 [Gonapodya prolifera JEL478]
MVDSRCVEFTPTRLLSPLITRRPSFKIAASALWSFFWFAGSTAMAANGCWDWANLSCSARTASFVCGYFSMILWGVSTAM